MGENPAMRRWSFSRWIKPANSSGLRSSTNFNISKSCCIERWNEKSVGGALSPYRIPRWANSPAAMVQTVFPDAAIVSWRILRNRSTVSRTAVSRRLMAEKDERTGTIVNGLVEARFVWRKGSWNSMACSAWWARSSAKNSGRRTFSRPRIALSVCTTPSGVSKSLSVKAKPCSSPA